MADYPLPITAGLIPATLCGRKAQTRRVIQGVGRDNCITIKKPTKTKAGVVTHVIDAASHPGLLPYAAGDRLWVREAWRTWAAYDNHPPRDLRPTVSVYYEASKSGDAPRKMGGRYRAARFMPRWASHLTLIVTDVRVEQVQDISAEDAIAEGIAEAFTVAEAREFGLAWGEVPADAADDAMYYIADYDPSLAEDADRAVTLDPRAAFQVLWDNINADRKDKDGVRRPYAWGDNPWVVVIGFRAVQANIDHPDFDQIARSAA